MNIMSYPLCFLGLCALSTVQGQIVFSAGTPALDPNTPGQAIEFFIDNQGASPVSVGALDLVVEIGGGGPVIPFPSVSLSAPVDLVSGTIFQNNNLGNFADGANAPRLQLWSTEYKGAGDPTPPPVLQPGLNKIATITFDTTGLNSGSWQLLFSGTTIGDSLLRNLSGRALVLRHPEWVANGDAGSGDQLHNAGRRAAFELWNRAHEPR